MDSHSNSLLIIAEAAQGYEGDPAIARALVRGAAGAGADALKLQLVYADELCTPDYRHHALFRSLELSDEHWHDLAQYAREKKIGLMLDVFGSRSLALAVAVHASGVKVHSTDMCNIGLLREVANSPIPLVLLSTGGCTRNEIIEALAILAMKDTVLLHGFQGYPTPLAANQIGRLAALNMLALTPPRTRPARLGIADHVPSDDPLRFVLAAVAMGVGARVIEKHMTLSQVMKMEDHESALNPDELAIFVATMRRCLETLEAAPIVSAADFGMHESELAYRASTRKHVVALRPIAAGSTLAPDMIGLKRTSAERFICDPRQVYGKRLVCDVVASMAIAPEMLEGNPG